MGWSLRLHKSQNQRKATSPSLCFLLVVRCDERPRISASRPSLMLWTVLPNHNPKQAGLSILSCFVRDSVAAGGKVTNTDAVLCVGCVDTGGENSKFRWQVQLCLGGWCIWAAWNISAFTSFLFLRPIGILKKTEIKISLVGYAFFFCLAYWTSLAHIGVSGASVLSSWEDGAHWPQGHWIWPSFFPLSLLFFFSWLSSNTMCLEHSHFRNQKSYPKILVWQKQKLSFNVLRTGVWLRRDGKEYLKATWK